MQADRQTDIQTEIQKTDVPILYIRQTYIQTYRQTGNTDKKEKQTNKHTYSQC